MLEQPTLRKSVAIRDSRGVFSPTKLDDDCNWVQTNVSYNEKAKTFRGMHFQKFPHAQRKLVKVISGAITDFVIDLRPGDNYLKVQKFKMAEGDELNIPKGFAHGFITLVKNTVVQYLVDYKYIPEEEVSINFESFREIRIEIAMTVVGYELVISKKDKEALRLENITKDELEYSGDNYYNHNETILAKLRNQLSPIYGLPEAVLMMRDKDDDRIKEIVFKQAEKANKDKEKIKEMLNEIGRRYNI